MKTKKEYWVTNSRFKLIVLILVVMWLLFLGFLFLETEAISKNPCSICAKRLGEDITCTTPTWDFYVMKRIFYYNGSQEIIKPHVLP